MTYYKISVFQFNIPKWQTIFFEKFTWIKSSCDKSKSFKTSAVCVVIFNLPRALHDCVTHMPWLLHPFMHIVPHLLQVSHAYYNLIIPCLVALVPYTVCAFEFFCYLRFFLAGTTDNAHDYQLLQNVITILFFLAWYNFRKWMNLR